MQLPRAVCILPAGAMFILNLLPVSGTKDKGEYGDIRLHYSLYFIYSRFEEQQQKLHHIWLFPFCLAKRVW